MVVHIGCLRSALRVDNEGLVFWPTTVQAAALFASTGLSIWAAVIARTRRGVPGGVAFGWMMLAVALWSLTSAMHTLVDDSTTRIVIAKFQYLGVAPIGVLWLLFTTEYSRIAWPAIACCASLVWIVPVVTLMLVATNERHSSDWSGDHRGARRRTAAGSSIAAGRGTGSTPATATS